MRTIWIERDGVSAGIIDQTQLPHRFVTVRLATLEDAARAIRTMQVRGAPLIGTTAAYGVWLASRADASDEALEKACSTLAATRPTAINLKWALDEMVAAVRNRPRNERPDAAFLRAGEIADEDVTINRAIGAHGLQIIEDITAQKKKGEPVNVLTHPQADVALLKVDPNGIDMHPLQLGNSDAVQTSPGSWRPEQLAARSSMSNRCRWGSSRPPTARSRH